jgi:hypothetical protein
MEILLGLLFRHIDGSEAALSALLVPEADGSDPQASLAITGQDQKEAELSHDAWRKSTVVKQIARLLPFSDALEDDEPFAHTQDDTPALASSSSAAPEPPGLELRRRSPRGNRARISLAGDRPRARERSLSQTSASPQATTFLPPINTTTPPPSSTYLPPPPNNNSQLPHHWSYLLDVYFSNTHCWFPIAQKHDVLRPAYLLSSAETRAKHDALAAGDCAYLWAIFAYSSYQCDAASIPMDYPPDSTKVRPSSPHLLSVAESLIPLDPLGFKPGHIRALLLLSLLKMGQNAWTSAWVFVGRAIYMAIDLGIIPQEVGKSSSKNDILLDDGQKRTALGCFALDTLIAAHLGRRPYLRKSDLPLIGLLQTDGIEEWEPWQSSTPQKDNLLHRSLPHRQSPGRILSIFNQFIGLLGLLNNVICQSVDTLSENWVSVTSQSLNTWQEQLPSYCQIQEDVGYTTKVQKLPQLLNLNLAAAGVFETLIDFVGEAYATSTEPALIGFSGQTPQLVKLVTEHIHSFGGVWVPPTFEVFLSRFKLPVMRWRNLQSSTSVTALSNSIRQLLTDVKRIWQGSTARLQTPVSFSTRRSTPRLDIRPEEPLASQMIAIPYSDPSEVNLSPETHFNAPPQGPLLQAAIFAPPFSLESTTMPNPGIVSPIMQRGHADTQLPHLNSTAVSSTAYAQTVDLATLTESLASEADDDNLFNSLTMLDHIDW